MASVDTNNMVEKLSESANNMKDFINNNNIYNNTKSKERDDSNDI